MSRAPTGAGQVRIRRATRRDLDALVELEQGFPGDRMTRAGLSRLLARDSAEIWVAEVGDAVVGDATAPLHWVGLPPPPEPPMVHAAPVVHASIGPPRALRLV